MRPARIRLSEVHDVMQITLTKGEWIQVCLTMHEPGTEPCYEIVQVSLDEKGNPELRANIPAVRWSHEAKALDEDEPATLPVVREAHERDAK